MTSPWIGLGTAGLSSSDGGREGSSVRTADGNCRDSWLTVNREYQVLSVFMAPKGPAKLRIVADDGRTPILADAPCSP
jgi:hypothetical protein